MLSNTYYMYYGDQAFQYTKFNICMSTTDQVTGWGAHAIILSSSSTYRILHTFHSFCHTVVDVIKSKATILPSAEHVYQQLKR